MVLVESALVFIHVRIAGPGFRDEHGHDVGQGTARLVKKLDCIIERSGVATLGHDDGIEVVDLAVVDRALQYGLSRIHPADVAADGVDLAVVRHVVIRMGQLPAGKRVGREALMHKTKRAGHERIGKLEVKLLNLRGQHQALVDDGAAREGRDVEIVLAFDVGGGHLVLSSAAHAVEQALEGFLVQPLWLGRQRAVRYKAARRGLRGRWRRRSLGYRASRER